MQRVSKRTGAQFVLELMKDDFVPPFSGSKNNQLAARVKQAAQAVGLAPRFVTSFSSSDANSFAHLGYPVLSVARGGAQPHALTESLNPHDLVTTQALLTQILLKS